VRVNVVDNSMLGTSFAAGTPAGPPNTTTNP
jgi:hypothetical protein